MTVETPPAHLGRLDNIQALRGIAALIVVFYHLALFLREGVFPGQSGFLAGPWDQGWAGVDLFFVISGFIMVWTTQNHTPSIKSSLNFLWRRATRIYPLWWICAAVMAVYFVIAYGMPAAPDRVTGPGEAWGYALKSFALWPQDAPPLLGLGWTLIHEMWFYLVFAGLLLAPRRFLMPSLIIWAVLTLAHYFSFGAIDVTQAVRKVATSPLNLEFIGGALIAYILLKRPVLARPVGWTIFAVGVMWVCAAMMFDFRFVAQDHHFTRMVVYGPAMGLIVWGSTSLTLAGGLSVPRWLTRLGDWSYALYLIHYIVLVALKRLLSESGAAEAIGTSVLGPVMFAITALTVSLVAAWGLHRFVERPLLSWFRRRGDRSPGRTFVQ